MIRLCLLLLLLVNLKLGYALHCHMCNSQNRDCTTDHLHLRNDAFGGKDKSCVQSFRETLNSVKSLYPEQKSMDVEALVKQQKSSEHCVRFSLSKRGENNATHFFGCSVLDGRDACMSMQKAMNKLHFHGCHVCSEDMCNHATLPFISAYLAATLVVLLVAFA